MGPAQHVGGRRGENLRYAYPYQVSNLALTRSAIVLSAAEEPTTIDWCNATLRLIAKSIKGPGIGFRHQHTGGPAS